MQYLHAKDYHQEVKRLLNERIRGYPEHLKEVIDLLRKWHYNQQRFFIKTSGSTGKPKSIRIEREDIARSAQATAKYFGIQEGDTALLALSPTTIGGFMMVMRAMVNEWNLYVASPASNPLEEIQSAVSLSFAAFVPMQMAKILEKNDQKELYLLNQMKAIILGGAPVNRHLHEKIKNLAVPVYHTYGMTESISHIAAKRLNADNGNETETFSIIPGNSVTTDEKGRLIITQLHEKIKHLVTNDIVEIVNKNEFRYLGRYDNMINSGGVKVLPEKVEKQLQEAWKESVSNEVPEFLVFGKEDSTLGERVTSLVEGKHPGEEFIQKFNNQLKKQLHPYEIPKELIFECQFKYTPNEKLDRKGTIMENAF